MPPDQKLTLAVLQTLGLSGALGTAVSCGPCLDYAPVDSGSDDTGDTGDTGEEEGSSEDAALGVAASPHQAAARVLDRGVLPEDVAAILKARQEP